MLISENRFQNIISTTISRHVSSSLHDGSNIPAVKCDKVATFTPDE